MVVICDRETNAILATDIWSSPEWEQSRQLDQRVFVAFQVSGHTYHQARELLLKVISDPRNRYNYLMGWFEKGASMLVSLSASHGNDARSIAVLAMCDLIYTTQWSRLDELRLLFPQVDIRPIPDNCPDLLDFLLVRHKDDEVYTFGDLLHARRTGSGDSSPKLPAVKPLDPGAEQHNAWVDEMKSDVEFVPLQDFLERLKD